MKVNLNFLFDFIDTHINMFGNLASRVQGLLLCNAFSNLISNIQSANIEWLHCSSSIYMNIIQIYHAWEGYLRKIPVLRLNFIAIRLGKFFVSRLVFFANTPPKHDKSVQNCVSLISKIEIYFMSSIVNEDVTKCVK